MQKYSNSSAKTNPASDIFPFYSFLTNLYDFAVYLDCAFRACLITQTFNELCRKIRAALFRNRTGFSQIHYTIILTYFTYLRCLRIISRAPFWSASFPESQARSHRLPAGIRLHPSVRHRQTRAWRPQCRRPAPP